MKVQSRPAPVLETIGDAGSAGSKGGEYGKAFENLVRGASAQSEKAKAEVSKSQDPRAEGAEGGEKTLGGKDGVADKDALEKGRDGEKADGAETEIPDILDLSKLVNALAPERRVSVEDGEKAVTDASVSSIVAAGEPSLAETEPSMGAGVVRLQVLRMETHFEPETRNMVLVDGQAAETVRAGATAAASVEAGETAAPKLSFDQMLQRLDRLASATKDGTADEETGGVAAADRPERGARAEARQAAAGRLEAVAQRSRNAEEAPSQSFAALASLSKAANEIGSDPLAGAVSLTTQVAGRILDSFGSLGDAQGQADLPPGEAHLRMRAGGAALKTLTIQLQPESMGKLEVAMRLVDGQLTLELAASEPETARALANDRDGLRKLLEHAGFSLDDGSIAIVTRDVLPGVSRSDAGNGQSQGGQSSAGRQTGQGEGGAQAQGEAANSNRQARRDDSQGQDGRSPRAGETKTHAATGTYL